MGVIVVVCAAFGLTVSEAKTEVMGLRTKGMRESTVFGWFGTRVTCEMVSDGGGRFIPAGIVSFHTLYLLLAFLVAHDRATEDNHTHHTGKERQTLQLED